MTLRHLPLRTMALGFALALWMGASPATADAQTRREGKWQFNIPITFTFSTSFDGEGESVIEVNNDVGFGFGFGYHLNEKFMLGFEATWLRAGYEATIPYDDDGDQNPDGTSRIGGNMDATNLQAVGQFNILEGNLFTPFIRANLGTTYTDSNIASGPPQGSCWWHPWWGYICGSWVPTYDRWSFSFGGAAGIRADINRSFFLEASFNGLWINFDNSTPVFDGIRLNIGWLF